MLRLASADPGAQTEMNGLIQVLKQGGGQAGLSLRKMKEDQYGRFR
jgi:hypothetical protein